MVFKGWEKIKIKKVSGEVVDGIAPVIISASRSTDIPAFYAQWFIEQLNKGYIKWINPFNGKPQFVSFDKTHLIIFWSKNPSPIIPLLDELNKRDIRYLFQITLNDYEAEKFERHLPPLSDRIETFKLLSRLIGKENVLWRFDPLILTTSITPEILIERIMRIGNEVSAFTQRLTISFLTRYLKVCRNLQKAGIILREFDQRSIDKIGRELNSLRAKWGIEIVSCAEQVDLSAYNIHNGSCIDPFIIAKNFGEDPELNKFLGLTIQNGLFGQSYTFRTDLKDPGQRELCNCIVSKDIGMYNTCPHGCVYCYANSSFEKARENYRTGVIKNL